MGLVLPHESCLVVGLDGGGLRRLLDGGGPAAGVEAMLDAPDDAGTVEWSGSVLRGAAMAAAMAGTRSRVAVRAMRFMGCSWCCECPGLMGLAICNTGYGEVLSGIVKALRREAGDTKGPLVGGPFCASL